MILLRENLCEIYKTEKAFGFKLKNFEKKIWIPKVFVDCWPSSYPRNTRFLIPDWIWDKKVDELFGGK
jgi:hypothetical protein